MNQGALVALLLLGTACGGSPARPAPAPAPVVKAPAPPPPPTLPTEPQPPIAAKKPFDVKSPHGTRVDPYYWLRDDARKNPEMLAYLDAENAYTKAVLAPVANVEATIFEEMKSRVKEDDASVPVFEGGYWYYTRFETGKQYRIHCRRKGTMQAAEQIILDENTLAAGQPYYAVGATDISRDGKLLAYAEDTVGRRQYVLRVKNLETGALLPDSITNIDSIAWANDNKTLFVTGKDETTLREDRVWRVVLGASPVQIYQEPDAQFVLALSATKSHRYVSLVHSSSTTSEVRLLDADAPTARPRVFLPRKKDHLYQVDHLDGRFLVLTNDKGKNFRIAEVKDGKEADPKNWKDLVAHDPAVLVEAMALYRGFVGVSVRSGGLRKGLVIRGKDRYMIDAPDPTYVLQIVDTPDPAATKLRYSYSSPTTPATVFAMDPATKKKTVLKQQPVPGYDASLYTSEYVSVRSADGTSIPVSVVYKKTTPRDGTAPLLVYGYGSYGFSMEPRMNPPVVSLLDRGWVYAIAHIRGGEEMGRAWYEAGKLMNKKNTFTDFIDASAHLVEAKYGAKNRVFAMGGSAGGLLVGAVVNMRPDLYRGVIADVPFVDVVTTMLDSTIPLTTGEYEEWGNPAQLEAYNYMLSYSPYDQVAAKAYPAMYVKTGLWDSQVQYYEPTKWVAKLRATKTDKNPLLLETDMTSGHGGASGRYEALKVKARQYAFLLFANERPDARAAN